MLPGVPGNEVVRAVVIALYNVRAEKGAAAQHPLTSFMTLKPAPHDTHFCLQTRQHPQGMRKASPGLVIA